MAGSPVELVKEKLDVVELLKGYLTLTPAGRNFKALCPFHREKTPSFMVSPERQSWHCFGCGIGGDIFSFVMRYENIEFGEALRILAEKAGIELRRMNPAEYKVAGLLYELQDAAKVFFRQALERSPHAKAYVAERGLESATIEEFDIGWAPNEQDALSVSLMKSGYSPDDIIRAGLAVKTERGMQLDRFRGRIMFPIENHLGKTVGFTGRILPSRPEPAEGSGNPSTSSGFAVAKYMNSPETPIFNKSKLLYGFSKTKNAIRDAGWALVVEGQMDCVMSFQAGVKNVVATSGTALTLDHLRALRRLTERLVMSFDSDEAGLVAGERAIDLAQAADFDVKVLTFANYKDPGEAAQADPEAFRAAVELARPAAAFYFDRYLPSAPPLAHARDRRFLTALRTVIAKLKGMASAVERSTWFAELAKRTGIEENALHEEAARIEIKETTASNETTTAEPGASVRSITRRELLSERLLAVLFAKGNLDLLSANVVHLAPTYQPVFELLKRGERRADDAAVDEQLNLILLRSELVEDPEIEILKEHLASEYLKDRRRELTTLVRAAEEAGDEAALTAALEELQGMPGT